MDPKLPSLDGRMLGWTGALMDPKLPSLDGRMLGWTGCILRHWHFCLFPMSLHFVTLRCPHALERASPDPHTAARSSGLSAPVLLHRPSSKVTKLFSVTVKAIIICVCEREGGWGRLAISLFDRSA